MRHCFLSARALGKLNLASEFVFCRAVPDQRIHEVVKAAGKYLVELGGGFVDRRADRFSSGFIVGTLSRVVIRPPKGSAFYD